MSFLCSFPLISALFASCAPPAPLATGYVEGEYVLIAPIAQAELRELPVARGDRVEAGQVVAELETLDAELQLAASEATLAQAQSQLANLEVGRRPEEIRVLEAALQSARAQSDEADRQLSVQAGLRDRNVISQAQFDLSQTSADIAHARVAEAEAQLAVARLPARPDEIAAARAGVNQARAARDAASWQVEQRQLLAPSAGVIFDLIRSPGELAGPSAPVLSYLPDGAVKLRLYVPETRLSTLSIGDRLSVNCDGCAASFARVTYVSNAPEFTPPVIYSLENRQRLVYLIEAAPEDGSTLSPGQIVDVDLAQRAETAE